MIIEFLAVSFLQFSVKVALLPFSFPREGRKMTILSHIASCRTLVFRSIQTLS